MNGKKAKLLRRIAREVDPAIVNAIPQELNEVNKDTGVSIGQKAYCLAGRRVYKKFKKNFMANHNLIKKGYPKLRGDKSIGLLKV